MDEYIHQSSNFSVGTMGSGAKSGPVLASTIIVASLLLLILLIGNLTNIASTDAGDVDLLRDLLIIALATALISITVLSSLQDELPMVVFTQGADFII